MEHITMTIATASSTLAAAVERSLPGWELEPDVSAGSADGPASTAIQAQPGVDIATLRRKFLPSSEASDAGLGGASGHRTSESVEVFRVQPKGGRGQARVAERRNGKITIISGGSRHGPPRSNAFDSD